ncbi:MAG: inner membrane CreD family protein, partial [Pseudomonadota bacterium]
MKWSSGLRFAMVGGLALAMFVPLLLASEVIHERADYARAATVSVGQEWGGEQTLLGPVLVIPVEGPVTRTERREAVDPATGKVDVELFEVTEIVPKKPIRVLPDRFDLTITSTSQVRRRGIFEVPVYTAQARFLVDFDVATRPLPLEEDETVLWEAAHLSLSLSSNRALRGETALTVDGRQIALEPMAAPHHGPEARTGGITAALGDPR